MVKTRFFQQITIASGDIENSAAQLGTLLGQAGNLFTLDNVDVQLVPGHSTDDAGASICGLEIHSAAVANVSDMRGLTIQNADTPAAQIPSRPQGGSGIKAIDHIVLMSNNADDCIRLFRDDLGMRLALDQLVPEWGGRMLFFREGSMTLEVIHNLEKPPESDHFWGISYRCDDIQSTHRHLSEIGVEMSEVRPGRKPGTAVASIKSHSAGIPSLLVGPEVQNGNKS